jgi:hypothetical protein
MLYRRLPAGAFLRITSSRSFVAAGFKPARFCVLCIPMPFIGTAVAASLAVPVARGTPRLHTHSRSARPCRPRTPPSHPSRPSKKKGSAVFQLGSIQLQEESPVSAAGCPEPEEQVGSCRKQDPCPGGHQSFRAPRRVSPHFRQEQPEIRCRLLRISNPGGPFPAGGDLPERPYLFSGGRELASGRATDQTANPSLPLSFPGCHGGTRPSRQEWPPPILVISTVVGNSLLLVLLLVTFFLPCVSPTPQRLAPDQQAGVKNLFSRLAGGLLRVLRPAPSSTGGEEPKAVLARRQALDSPSRLAPGQLLRRGATIRQRTVASVVCQ